MNEVSTSYREGAAPTVLHVDADLREALKASNDELEKAQLALKNVREERNELRRILTNVELERNAAQLEVSLYKRHAADVRAALQSALDTTSGLLQR